MEIKEEKREGHVECIRKETKKIIINNNNNNRKFNVEQKWDIICSRYNNKTTKK